MIDEDVAEVAHIPPPVELGDVDGANSVDEIDEEEEGVTVAMDPFMLAVAEDDTELATDPPNTLSDTADVGGDAVSWV